MEAYFDSIFEDVRHERSLIFLLSIIEPDILRQSKFLDLQKENIKNIGLEKLNRQPNPKEFFAMDLLEKQFSDRSI